MPWFVVVAAAGATVALARKIVARHTRGLVGLRATEDPPGIRTVARFVIEAPEDSIDDAVDGTSLDDVLLALAAELSREFDQALEVTADAVRASPRPGAGGVDIVRLARRCMVPPTYTAELTRAWTGIHFDDDAARKLLAAIHVALTSHPRVRELGWYLRQDRHFETGHATPHDVTPS